MSVAWSKRVILAAVLAMGAACPALAAQGKRVALVIGNSAYEHTSLLANPANDADDVAETLSALGFEVTKRQDLKKYEMDGTLSAFAGSLKGAEIGLFYYAGHGLQVGGQNYLVPVDARLETASALDFEAVRLDVIQRIMENETQTNVLILDACRDNPLTRNLARSMGARSSAIGKGLAPQESGAGTIISYSTQPGNVALDGTGKRNSPFAAALVKHLPSEGRDLSFILVKVRNDVMAATAKRQVPWEHSALTDELVLARASAATAPTPPAEPSAEIPAARKVEESAEERADGSGAFQAFLTPDVPQVSKPHPVADEPRNESAGNAASAAPQQIKAPVNQLTYGLNRGVRFFVQSAYSWNGECTLQFAESAQPKMKQLVLKGGDYVEFKVADGSYRGTVVRVTNDDCTLEIAPTPGG